MLVGEKLAVRPAGCPVTLRLTADLNVEEMVVETETVVLLPTRIVAELTDVLMANVGGIVTIKFTAADLVVPPEVAVTVSRKVPAATFSGAVNVRTAAPDPGADKVLGLKLAVIPAGSPVTDNAT